MTSRGGAPDVFVTKQFTVPAGADHLDASIAWADPNGTTKTLVLMDPTGTFVGTRCRRRRSARTSGTSTRTRRWRARGRR